MKKRISKHLLLVVILCSGFIVGLSAQDNLAPNATASTSFVSTWETLNGLNEGTIPSNSSDRTGGIYGNWDTHNTTQWVQYEWSKMYKFSSTEIYWFTDGGGVLIPTMAYIEYWNGASWVKAGNIGVEKDKFNILDLSDIVTDKIRISMFNLKQSTGICEWRVNGGVNLPSVAWEGDSYSLDNISQSVTVPSNILQDKTDFTIATWVKVDTLQTGTRIFDFGDSTSHMYLTGKGTNDNIEFGITTSGCAGEQYISGTTNEPQAINTWQHIAVVQSGTTGILYLNGVEIGRDSTLNISDLGGLTNNYIGKSQNNDLFLEGQIEEFKIYATALTQSQIAKTLINIKNATLSTPKDNWIIVSTNPSKKLEWNSGSYFTSTNVYFGDSYYAVNSSTTPYVSDLAPEISFVDISNELTEGQTYYWRIDEINGDETRKGDVYRFKYISSKVKVFLMGGQSNMAGTTPLNEISEDYKHSYTDAIIWVDGQTTQSLARNWMPLTSGLGITSSYFGPELSFGPEIASLLPEDNIALLKCSWGGTNLYEQWRPPSSGGTTGYLYNNFVQSVKDGLAALPAGLEPEIAGMLWMQGEADAISNQTHANEYESNLTNLISDIRSEVKNPEMPFVIGQIGSAPAWDPFGSTIKAAQLAVSQEVANTSMIRTNDYGLTNDPWHYNGAGELSLGIRFARAMKTLLDVVLDIDALSSVETNRIYPNLVDSSGKLDFDFGFGNSMNEKKTIKIIDLQGQVMYEGETSDTHFTINTSGSLKHRGSYFVTIKAGNKMESYKLIVR